MIVRLADSCGWDVPPWESFLARAPAMLEGVSTREHPIGALQ